MVLRRLLLWLLLSTACTLSAATSADERLAKQFYPETLRQDAMEERYSFVHVGYGGHPYLVVSYTNGVGGVVRVLAIQGEDATLACEANLGDVGGVRSEVKALDVDNDSVPEIVLTLSSFQGHPTEWVLRWNGSCLESIGPTGVENGKAFSLIGGAELVDLDGDHVLELVDGSVGTTLNPDGEKIAHPSWTVYSMKEGHYVETAALSYYDLFVRNTKEPVDEKITFEAQPTKDGVVKIINGESGKNLVDSAFVTLNGRRLAGPSDFAEKKPILIIKGVTLLEENELAVELRSAPGSELRVLVNSGP